MTIYIGTSGWQYRDWKPSFYPPRLVQARWLRYFAERFQIVEVNNSFYRLPSKDAVRHWADATPADFRFCMKMSRFLTHLKRLKDPAEPIARFVDVASELGARLGPVLMQLPPSLGIDFDRLTETLRLWPRAIPLAIEFRHDSWYTPETEELLGKHAVALCIADRKNRILTPTWQTANWTYVRLHEGAATGVPSCYSAHALQRWADRLVGFADRGDVYVFFNNDHRCCAVLNAAQIAAMLRRRGYEVSRTPALDQVAIEDAA